MSTTPEPTDESDPVAEPPEAMLAVPLEYAATSETCEVRFALRCVALAAWACVAITPLLMTITSTNAIVVTGAGETMLGVCMCAFGKSQRAEHTMMLGAGHLTLAIGTTLWIAIFDISPRGAHLPVLVIASVATAAAAYPTWKVFTRRWR